MKFLLAKITIFVINLVDSFRVLPLLSLVLFSNIETHLQSHPIYTQSCRLLFFLSLRCLLAPLSLSLEPSADLSIFNPLMAGTTTSQASLLLQKQLKGTSWSDPFFLLIKSRVWLFREFVRGNRFVELNFFLSYDQI